MTAADKDAELRAAFEAAAKVNGMYLNRHDDGSYVAPAANAAWWAWQEATRRASANSAEILRPMIAAEIQRAYMEGAEKGAETLISKLAAKIPAAQLKAALVAAAPEEKEAGMKRST